MGNHVSKHKKQNKSSSGTKTTTTSRLGSTATKTTPVSNAQPVSAPKSSTATKGNGKQFTKESRPLGSKESDESNGVATSNNNSNSNNNNNTPQNAREALARAAEERYKKLQDQKIGQGSRLRAKAKQSKNDKGL